MNFTLAGLDKPKFTALTSCVSVERVSVKAEERVRLQDAAGGDAGGLGGLTCLGRRSQ